MEQQLTFFLALAVGLIFGGLAVWLMMRAESNNAYNRAKSELTSEQTVMTERLSGKEARIDDLVKERDQLRGEVDRLREEIADLKSAKTELQTKLDESQKAAEEKLALLDESQQKLSDTFKTISAEALQSNNQAFLDLAKETFGSVQPGAAGDLETRQMAIDDLIQPLKESLGKVDANIQEMEKARVAAYDGISEQVRSLGATQELLRNEASSLVSAFRTPTVRGRWGDLQLRRVVEMAGMVPYCDFVKPAAVEGDAGEQRPDMIIRLPNERQLAVDTKVSLKAYIETLDAYDDDTRAVKLKEHAALVRAHLTNLGSKQYWEQFPSKPEFVVAFMPAEAIFSAALEQDPDLIEFGADQRVILATPTTLVALLKSIAYGWRQENVAQNAHQISNLGKTLYARLKTFTEHLQDVRRHLQRTVEGYNNAVGSLESKVLVSARQFRDLGAATKGEILYLEPVDSFPRSLEAVERAVSNQVSEPDPAPVELDETAPEPDETIVELSEDAIILDEIALELDETVAELEEDAVELDETTVELDELTVELDEPAVELDETTVELDEAVTEVEVETAEVVDEAADEPPTNNQDDLLESEIEMDPDEDILTADEAGSKGNAKETIPSIAYNSFVKTT